MTADFYRRRLAKESTRSDQEKKVRLALGPDADELLPDLPARFLHGEPTVSKEVARLLNAKGPFVPLHHIRFDWKCSDAKKHKYDGQESLSPDLHGSFQSGEILITEDGFCYVPGLMVCGAAAEPGPTFCALIDPDRGPHSQAGRPDGRPACE